MELAMCPQASVTSTPVYNIKYHVFLGYFDPEKIILENENR